jgi:hypothetical protein
MKNQLLLLFSFLAFVSNAQSIFRPASWQIGLHGSRSSLRTITELYEPPSANLGFTYNIPSNFLPNYGISIGTEFIITDWLTLRLQAKYHNQRYRTILGGLRFGTDFNNGNITESKNYYNYSYHFVSPSLAVLFNIPNNSRFYIGASANPSFSFRKNVKSVLRLGNGSIENKSSRVEDKTFGFTTTYLQAFVGYRQPLSNDFMLSIEPYIEYSGKLFTLDRYGSTAKFSNIGLSIYFAKNHKSASSAKCYHF